MPARREVTVTWESPTVRGRRFIAASGWGEGYDPHVKDNRVRSGPAEGLERLQKADRVELRRRFAETTYSERLRTCLELSELAADLRQAVRRKS